MSEYRDTELGEALHGLGLPDHGDDFFTELWAEADREQSAGTARTDGADAESAGGRIGWWARPRARLVAVAAAAITAVIVVALVGLPREGSQPIVGPESATAADVLASMDLAGRVPMTVTADIVSTYYGPDGEETLTLRRHVVIDTLGDWMRTLTADGDPEAILEGALFDARRLQSGRWRAPDDWDGVSEVPGVLSTNVPTSHGIRARYSELVAVSLIRALLVGRDAPAEAVTFLARDAWRIELDVFETGDELRQPDHVELTIDKATGYPLETIDWRGDVKDAEHRVVSFRVEQSGVQDKSAGFEAAQKAIANPYGDPPEDLGCRRAPLERFVELVGRPAIVADWMPDGFTFADATAKSVAGTGYHDTPETSVVYRGGLWSFAVDSFDLDKLGVSDSQAIRDPVAESDAAREEVVTLHNGLFKGREAHIVMDARARYSASHLWVGDNDAGIAVAILGDLSRDEFVAVAESLKEGPK